jgi:hypothetical protein
MKQKLVRGLVSVGLASALLAGTAMSASATETTDLAPQDAGDCIYFLVRAGYNVGPQRAGACRQGEDGGIDWLTCYARLVSTRVHQQDARIACNLAAN